MSVSRARPRRRAVFYSPLTQYGERERAFKHDVAECLSSVEDYFAGAGSPGTQRLPKAGSLCGVGGSCQEQVAGGRT